MMRSLYSGISGLSVHQTKMDVIGNNIANVNTVGFKGSKVSFSDVFYQTIQSATGPNETTGAAGQNAMQIGLGSTVSSIVSSPSKTGGAQRTDNPFDIMINGDSFFVVNQGGTNYFTKAGNFKIDGSGTLATTSGGTVMGWQVDPNDPTKTVADVVSPLRIMSPENLYSPPVATTAVTISGNIDSKDTQLAIGGSGKTVNISFYDSLGQEYNATVKLMHNTTGTAPNLTDVDNQYTVQLMDVLDSNGKSIYKTGSGTAADPYKETSVKPISFGGIDYTLDTATGKLTTTGALPVITFNANTGKFVSAIGAGTDNGTGTDSNKSLNFSITDTSAAGSPFHNITVDLSSITTFGGTGKTALDFTPGDLDNKGGGRKAGNMSGLSVDTSGKIYGSYDNGDSRLLGQIAVASFSNPAGLEAVGGNLFAQTQNSGKFDGIGKDVSSDGGSFTTGVLEMSNVDLASEFTEMITTQRGFQANSRVITTSDTLLEELINLKR
ncbi:flagellar hook protein FlgE [Anaerocolumna sp. AGMB13020]|uniref:flagellar hook protein FlgE n=1 Tax=Anaerocolumna sp. AGMB13020 TaxID=3081750 RepID=UPI002954CFA1|nr:flagellar hook protein FlgE [Anaerocolumna sp. AGMB13020]WOO36535.1 flagellar hook protein FlgE [Anaerocolumna sp. AGMB13020]